MFKGASTQKKRKFKFYFYFFALIFPLSKRYHNMSKMLFLWRVSLKNIKSEASF